MKNLLLSIFLIHCAAAVMSQDSLSHWTIGAQGSGFISYRNLQTSSELEDMKLLFDSIESGMVGMQLGLAAGYHINSSVDISAGITFQRAGYNIDTINEASIAHMKFRYGFLKVPIRAHFNFRKGKINRPFISAGVAANYCIADKTTFTQFGKPTVVELEKESIKGNILSELCFSAGLMKSITPKTTFRIAMEGTWFLSPLMKGELERRLWSAGLWMSLSHHIR